MINLNSPGASVDVTFDVPFCNEEIISIGASMVVQVQAGDWNASGDAMVDDENAWQTATMGSHFSIDGVGDGLISVNSQQYIPNGIARVEDNAGYLSNHGRIVYERIGLMRDRVKVALDRVGAR